MKQMKTIAMFLIAVSIPCSLVQAQAYNLQTCLDYALKHNQQIAISKYAEQGGEEKVRETRALALPQVNVNGSVSDNLKRQVIVLPAEFIGGQPGTFTTILAGTKYTAGATADASQQIFNQSVFTGLKAAKASRDYYEVNTMLTEEDVVTQVANAYYSILITREQIRFQKTNIQNLEQLIQTTRTQYETGLARKIDLDRISVSLTNSRTRNTQLENQLEIQQYQLKMLMGMPVEEPLQLEGVPLEQLETSTAGMTATSIQAFDPDKLLQVSLLDVQERLYKYQKQASVAEYYPKLSLFANYSYNTLSNEFDFLKKNGTSINYDMASVGLRLSIPIFDGFGRRARVAQNSIELHKLAKQKDYTLLQLNTAYESARVQMLNSINTINLQKENMELAREVYASSKQNYELGLATLTDLLNAETSLVEAQNSYAQALLNFQIAQIGIARSTGRIMELVSNQ